MNPSGLAILFINPVARATHIVYPLQNPMPNHPQWAIIPPYNQQLSLISI